MGLIVAGVIPIAFVALAVLFGLACPAALAQPRAIFFLGALTLFGMATGGIGARGLAGNASARIAGQLPAGLAAGALVQPSTAFIFALGIALAAVVGGPTRLPDRLYASALFLAGAVAGFALSMSPLVLGTPARCA